MLCSFENEGNPAICDNMGEFGGRYTERYKPDREAKTNTERYPLMWNLD